MGAVKNNHRIWIGADRCKSTTIGIACGWVLTTAIRRATTNIEFGYRLVTLFGQFGCALAYDNSPSPTEVGWILTQNGSHKIWADTDSNSES